MGLLVGLPLKIFALVFGVLRLAWPLLLALIVWLLMRRFKTRGTAPSSAKPDFDGPVVEVDYTVVEDDRED